MIDYLQKEAPPISFEQKKNIKDLYIFGAVRS